MSAIAMGGWGWGGVGGVGSGKGWGGGWAWGMLQAPLQPITCPALPEGTGMGTVRSEGTAGAGEQAALAVQCPGTRQALQPKPIPLGGHTATSPALPHAA